MGDLLALILIILSTIYFTVGTADLIRDKQIDGQVRAQQLLLWQAAASRVCQTTADCSPGVHLTQAQMNTKLSSFDNNAGGKGVFGNGTMASFSTGTRIVSYYAICCQVPYTKQVYGSMAAWLVSRSPSSNIRYVGTYDASTGTMRSGGTFGYNVRNPDGSYTRVSCKMAPLSLGGYTTGIPDGVPMLATDLYPASGTSGSVSPCT